MPVAQTLYGGSPVALTGNTDITLLESAERTAAVSTADQQAYFARGVYVYVKVTAVTGSPSLVLTLSVKLPNGDYVTLLTGAAITETGTFVYLLHPDAGVAAEGVTKVVNFPIPLNWRVTMTPGTADAISYTVMATVVV